ncbi:uncharacterized protein SPAPADRAFT_49836 [Spathaspora passalidarum NRRL Y-27907]|uniref:Protein RCR2 n=1 Tax=Spathaspora passalidarum (strain NRRL Y-27907 / 11-Y1) TaxID=619300 RepID=G3AKE7_SPAPN|nr:uncharacterized protein SPAPADRAFT_49836 [Spathaspora passalidarum NRRL Y-27907]EGW32904.1 hypothetical protein SPAPADRAFT_49836 [Spathaspora passalidarum NRRL Y-27907]
MYIHDKLLTHTLQKRSTGNAGYVFLANIIALMLAVVAVGVVNKRRKQRGIQPIYGTRWITPPTYRQSQHQYEQPDHIRDPDLPSAYVPAYTATANEHDMGYYDGSGKFHPNPNVKTPIPLPPPARHRTESYGDVAPIMNDLPVSFLATDRVGNNGNNCRASTSSGGTTTTADNEVHELTNTVDGEITRTTDQSVVTENNSVSETDRTNTVYNSNN